MQPFTSLVKPNPDVLSGPSNWAKYAADLHAVATGGGGRGGREYSDPDTFHRITHYTPNMCSILSDLESKICDGIGDAFNNIETPFGGGKTHTMIAAWHKAKEWGANRVSIVGTNMAAGDTVWGLIEKQLTDHIDIMAGVTSPGRSKIRELLLKHQPLLILIDELLEYTVKANGITVGKTTLAGQTVAFIQELAEEVGMLDNVCVVASFPASAKLYEAPGEARSLAESQLRSLRSVAGRKDRNVTPVSDEDAPNVIRARLFDTKNHDIMENSKHIVSGYADFCDKYGILPRGMNRRQYEEKFSHTYPFTPDVIDVLYGQWGTYDNFQRTRGVLRLLATVIHHMKDSAKPYITLADFDLSNDTIREELLRYVDERKFESVIHNDITGRPASGNDTGTRCATTVFMMSFNKDGGRGAAINDIKRAVATLDGPAVADVGDALEKMTHSLHYLDKSDGRYKFTQTPNINRIKEDMEVEECEIDELEKKAVQDCVGTGMGGTVYPTSSLNVDDDANLQLVIVQYNNMDMIRNMMEKRGENNRSFRNGVVVLCPSDTGGLRATLREVLVIDKLNTRRDILDGDRQRLKRERKDAYNRIPGLVFGAYTVLYVCGAKGPEKVPMSQGSGTLTMSVLEAMRKADLIQKKVDSDILANIYPGQTDAVAIYESMMRSPGAVRPISVDVVRDALQVAYIGDDGAGVASVRTEDTSGGVVPVLPTETDSGQGVDSPQKSIETKIVANMSVKSGREFDVAKLLQDAFGTGSSCTVTITMKGDDRLNGKFGDLQDLAKEIDPFGVVDHERQ